MTLSTFIDDLLCPYPSHLRACVFEPLREVSNNKLTHLLLLAFSIFGVLHASRPLARHTSDNVSGSSGALTYEES